MFVKDAATNYFNELYTLIFILRLQVVDSNGLNFVAWATLPAPVLDGTFSVEIQSAPSAAFNCQLGEPVRLSISVRRAEPSIVQVQPTDNAVSGSGGTVLIIVSGFPVVQDQNQLQVMIGNHSCAIQSSNDYSNGEVIIDVIFPSLSSGIYLLSILYPAPDSSWTADKLTALSQIVVSPSGCTLTCANGCEAAAVENSAQNATLVLNASINAGRILSSTDVLHLDCVLAAPQNITEPFRNNTCLITSFSTVQVPCGVNYYSCLNISVQYSVGQSFPSAPAAAALIVVTCDSGCVGTLSASVVFRRAPRVESAIISDSLATLVISLDAPIRSQATDEAWSNWCDHLSTDGVLGIRPQCLSNGASAATIYLGTNASLIPGTQIFLPSWGSNSAGFDFPLYSWETVLVQPALLPSVPTVRLYYFILHQIAFVFAFISKKKMTNYISSRYPFLLQAQ